MNLAVGSAREKIVGGVIVLINQRWSGKRLSVAMLT